MGLRQRMKGASPKRVCRDRPPGGDGFPVQIHGNLSSEWEKSITSREISLSQVLSGKGLEDEA